MSKIIIAEQTHKWVERCDELNKENSLLKKENTKLKNLLKANDEINTLKELLKECQSLFILEKGFMVKCIKEEILTEMITKINEVLK